MSNIIMTNGKPCCPNHGEPLEGIGFPTPSKGEGQCPASGRIFAFECETDELVMKRDKNGKPIKSMTWNVTGEEEIK